MYICLCNGYRESEIRRVAREGGTVASDAYVALGNGPCCGKCLDTAQSVIDGEHRYLRGMRAAAE